MIKDLSAPPVPSGEQGRLHSPPTLFPGTLRPLLSGHLSCDSVAKGFPETTALPLALKSFPKMQPTQQLCENLWKGPICSGGQGKSRLYGSQGGIFLVLA